MPIFPDERTRILSNTAPLVAEPFSASLEAVEKIKAVSLLAAANVSVANACIDAPGNIASVPLDSKGAWKLILPNTSPDTTPVSFVDKVNTAPVVPSPP